MQQSQTSSFQNINIFLLKVALAVGVLTLSAKVTIPFYPVPMTMQVAAVLLLAGLGGMKFGSASFLSYLAVGAAGLPVFAGTPEKGIGLLYMAGPTGGYLLGFLVTAFIVGWSVDRFGAKAVWASMPLGLVVIYTFGLVWLSRFVPAEKLLEFGVLPFLAGDILKVILAAALVVFTPSKLKNWIKG